MVILLSVTGRAEVLTDTSLITEGHRKFTLLDDIHT